MTVIRPNSISGVTSITAHTQSIEFYKSDGTLSGANLDGVNINTAGILTAANFKTGSSNLHSTGLTVGNNFLHTTGINVGTGATIHVPSSNVLTLGTNSNERVRIGSSGQIGLSGANYGSSGQVLTSQGSGSAATWSTVSGTTINNNANNRLITGSGTANTLEAESTLTYDGNQLNVVQTTSSSDSKVVIANSNTPGSGALRLEFQYGTGTTEGTNRFRFGYVEGYRQGGSNDGGLIFGTKPSNAAAPTERLRIDSSGRVLIGSSSNNTDDVGDSALQVHTLDDLHPAIRTNSASNNGYTMFGDAYKAGESQVNIGISHSSASLVLSQGCKVNIANDDAYVSSQGTYSTRPNVLRLDSDGSLSYHSREASATTPTDNAVTLTELFKIDRVGNIYQLISARSMYFGASAQLRIGVQSNGDSNIEAVSGDLKIMDGGSVITQVRSDGLENFQHVYPANDNSKDLGKSTKRWANIYTTDLHLSNEGKSNVVDGTWGDWTLQEGEDKIFMINNRTGKKYSLKMEEE